MRPSTGGRPALGGWARRADAGRGVTADIQSRLEVLRADATTLAAAYGSVQDESTTVTLDDRGAQISATVAAEVAAWEEVLVEHDYGGTVYPGAPLGRIREIYPVEEGSPPVVVDPPLVLGPEILVNVPAPPATGTVDGPGSYVPLPGTIVDDGPGSFVPPPSGPGGLIVDTAAPDQPAADPPPVDVNGQWGAANGEKPDPECIAIGGKPDGGIITGHPTGGPGVHRNDVNGDRCRSEEERARRRSARRTSSRNSQHLRTR